MRVDLVEPPEGIVEYQYYSNASFVRWAPGDGLVYELLAYEVSDAMDDAIGGNIVMSLSGGCPGIRTYVGHTHSIFTVDFVASKFGTDLQDDTVFCFAALLNWALSTNPASNEYADGVFKEVAKAWR